MRSRANLFCKPVGQLPVVDGFVDQRASFTCDCGCTYSHSPQLNHTPPHTDQSPSAELYSAASRSKNVATLVLGTKLRVGQEGLRVSGGSIAGAFFAAELISSRNAIYDIRWVL